MNPLMTVPESSIGWQLFAVGLLGGFVFMTAVIVIVQGAVFWRAITRHANELLPPTTDLRPHEVKLPAAPDPGLEQRKLLDAIAQMPRGRLLPFGALIDPNIVHRN